MTEKYRGVEMYECLECGSIHKHSSLAENCWYRDRMEDALEEARNHDKLARREMLDVVEGMVERGHFDDERFK